MLFSLLAFISEEPCGLGGDRLPLGDWNDFDFTAWPGISSQNTQGILPDEIGAVTSMAGAQPRQSSRAPTTEHPCS